MHFQLFQTLGRQLSGFVLPHALEHRNQIHHTAIRGAAGSHGAAGDENGRNVHPQRPHDHARHDFVAVGDADQAVQLVRHDHGLHRVGDELAAGQGVFHPGVPHGDAVIDADGVEFERYAPGFAHRLLDDASQFLQMHMSGDDFDERIANADERFIEILIPDSGSSQKTPVRCPFKTFLDDVATHIASARK